ncbi:unnamed protein product [Vitrella brassicaformis CCMP3155]|uniref:Uncharacterized protein n=1 Tax=Vitrella brassicaformis (strain CCMP3155) TaxID=1169540 RepID=A0A0G4F1C3_VITBC|nr:unnamed protein product [Vitrella brassicaformis CCMP3155]|eukprot:CEM05180.1 unnamed protein product [Vitrella brassicaformis CCMP3155]
MFAGKHTDVLPDGFTVVDARWTPRVNQPATGQGNHSADVGLPALLCKRNARQHARHIDREEGGGGGLGEGVRVHGHALDGHCPEYEGGHHGAVHAASKEAVANALWHPTGDPDTATSTPDYPFKFVLDGGYRGFYTNNRGRPYCEPCGYVSEHALKGSAARKAANEHNARFAAKRQKRSRLPQPFFAADPAADDCEMEDAPAAAATPAMPFPWPSPPQPQAASGERKRKGRGEEDTDTEGPHPLPQAQGRGLRACMALFVEDIKDGTTPFPAGFEWARQKDNVTQCGVPVLVCRLIEKTRAVFVLSERK